MTPVRFLGAILAGLLALSGLVPVTAVENIRDDSWTIAPGWSSWPSSLPMYLVFEADISASDLDSGVRFSIVLQGPVPQSLIEYVLTGISDLPPAGTSASFFVPFTLMCGPATDTVQAVPSERWEVWVSYCHPTAGSVVRVLERPGTSAGSRPAPDPFSLALLDENGVQAPHPTAAGALSCTTSPTLPVASRSQAWAELGRLKSARANRIQEHGDSGTLGIYFDAQGEQCTGTIRPGEPATIYILAKHHGISECGLTGAEFRIGGLPDSWQVYAVPDPTTLNIGNPFGDGVNAAFPSCQRPEDGPVRFYSVLVLASELESDLQFTVEPRNPPANPAFSCPLINLCDYPAMTKICVEGLPCHVNATSSRTCAAPLAAQPASWSAVKQMYRSP